mgnify:CR=1 FL=1
MKRDQTKDDLVNHLREQYGFLGVSAELYDSGVEAEAKRMASTIRTLVHDTDSSQSLLGLLGYKNRMHFVAQNYTHKPWNILMFHGLVGLYMPSNGPRFVPILDTVVRRLMPFEDWWEEPVLGTRSRDRLFSRRNIILALANKDGGSHVDPQLDEVYARLARDCDFGFTVGMNDQQFDWKQNPFLPSVRQIGHEMLHTLSALEVLRPPRDEPPLPGGESKEPEE